MNRGQFLSATVSAGAGIAAGPFAVHASDLQPSPSSRALSKNLPIGVFNPPFRELSLDEMIDKFSSMGIEAVEIGSGGYGATPQCPLGELVANPAKAHAWKKKFEDRGIWVMALSCHANALYPEPAKAGPFVEQFRQTIQLAGMLEIPTVVGFSGCPGSSPTDTTPAWITYQWPPEHAVALDWQWRERVIP